MIRGLYCWSQHHFLGWAKSFEQHLGLSAFPVAAGKHGVAQLIRNVLVAIGASSIGVGANQMASRSAGSAPGREGPDLIVFHGTEGCYYR